LSQQQSRNIILLLTQNLHQMQNLKINSTSTPYWCVVVPVDAIDLYIYNGIKRDSLCYSHGLLGSSWTELNLPLGNFEILGCITSSGMDEGVREVVGKADSIELYMDYANTECDQYSFKTAHASALSLLTHNQITLTADQKAVVVKQK